MRSIDIRTDDEGPVKVIRFASGEELSSAVEIQTYYPNDCKVFINSDGEYRSGRVGDNQFVLLDSEEDAKNLIKALERAIEFGFWHR